MNALELDTPALYVDLDALDRNLISMQARCREWGVALRPHAKTHKIPEIAQMQLDAGAVGLTYAKLGELEVMPGDDLLLAYPLMPEKLPRLQAQLSRGRRITAVVDGVEGARLLGEVDALVEVDVGIGRCGVRTPEQVVEVARTCARFRGLFYWPNWLDDAGFRHAEALIATSIRALGSAGLPPEVISGGSTPGASKTPLIPQTTEIRPGTYVFNDANCLNGGFARLEDCALKVLCTVVSTAVPGQAILDGGSKTFSSDATVGVGTFGHFGTRPWTMRKMNEEHGYAEMGEGSVGRARVGEKVWVIPSHACATVNLHDEVHFGRGGRVDGSWRVAARGKVR